MPNEIDIAKARCTKLAFEAGVKLSRDEDGGGPDFRIEAYTGQVVKRWWGELAIDVNGIKASQNLPIFRSHDSNSIVGFATSTWKDGSFFVEGRFSKSTESSKEVHALALEGFPWQASIGVSPIKIMSIEKDSSHEVNGKRINGPAEVWLESEVYEASFVPLGADGNTNVAMLTRFEEKPAPSEPLTREVNEAMTVEKLKEEHRDLFESIMEMGRKEGARAELERIKSVRAQSLSGHEAIIEAMIEDGKTTGEQAAVRILQAERQARDTARANLSADAESVPNVPVHQPVISPGMSPTEDLSTDIGRKAAWESNAGLRKEYGDQFEVFEAYEKHKHLAKVRG